MSEYFYCEHCGMLFEVANWDDVTGGEFAEEAQDVSCPHCRNACLHITDFSMYLDLRTEVWSLKTAERRIRESLSKRLFAQAEEA